MWSQGFSFAAGGNNSPSNCPNPDLVAPLEFFHTEQLALLRHKISAQISRAALMELFIYASVPRSFSSSSHNLILQQIPILASHVPL